MTGVSLVDVLLAAVAGSAPASARQPDGGAYTATAAPWREGSAPLMALIDSRIPEASR